MNLAQMSDQKRCSTCGAVKDRSAFGRDGRSADGLRYCCAECNRAKVRAWKKANPEKRAIIEARRRARHYERVREIERRSASRPESRQRQWQYRQRPEVMARKRELAATWREAHRGELRKYALHYYHNHVRTDEYLAAIAIYASTGLSPQAVPADIIRAKAAQLRVMRIIRSLEKGS